MGRASRRKKRETVLVGSSPGGTGIEMISKKDGSIQYQTQRRKLEPKRQGLHRLIVTVMFRTSYEQMIRMEAGSETLLDMENILDYAVGCWDCEQDWHACRDNPICPGDPSGRTHN